jgi:hypothetical protein
VKKKRATIVVADRYTALGIKPSKCDGPCEGTGFVPVFRPPAVASFAGAPRTAEIVERRELALRWHLAEKKEPADDGWHFVPCPRCKR